jgi:hypothetical protein
MPAPARGLFYVSPTQTDVDKNTKVSCFRGCNRGVASELGGAAQLQDGVEDSAGAHFSHPALRDFRHAAAMEMSFTGT